MSHVTNLILTTALIDDCVAPAIEALGFVRVDQHAGGPKRMESCVWLAAFNYLDMAELAGKLRAIAWESPDEVQLLVRDQGDEGFTEIFLA